MFEKCIACPIPNDCDRYAEGCFYRLKDRSAEYRRPQERRRIAKWKRDNKEKVNAINRAYRVRKQQEQI